MRVIDKIINNSGQLVSIKTFAVEYFTYHKKNIRKNYFDAALSNLNRINRAPLNVNEIQLLNEIILQFDDIVKAIPSEIPLIIQNLTTGTYSNLLYLGNRQTPFGKIIEDAFNYAGFRKSAKASWFAERLNIKACLYCNAQFALAVGKDGTKKKLLFQLDHFYNKKRYPFLSLTFGNLVPSCSTCNILKSSKLFDTTTNIHPFYEDANTSFEFQIDQNNALDYLLGKKDEKKLIPTININDPRINKHISVFHLTDIYSKHTDIIEELILKSIYYNKTKREELMKEFKDLNLNSSVIDRFVLGNYSLDNEINKRPLSKLSKDIAKQLKLI